MISQEAKKRLLDEALARTIPQSREWVRQQENTGDSGYWVEVQAPAQPIARHLTIVLRHDGDIQIEYHLAGKPSSPFEYLISLEPGHEEQAIEVASRFVADLVTERLVLAYAKGILKGGRRFLAPDLAHSDRGRLGWISSWLGTYDWEL